MKVTYNQILGAKPALEELAKKPVHIKEAVALARLIKKLNSELEIFTQKHRELCEKYGKADEKTGEYKIETENQDRFASDFAQLLSVEIDADISKVCVSSDINIEASVVLAAENFVKFKTE